MKSKNSVYRVTIYYSIPTIEKTQAELFCLTILSVSIDTILYIYNCSLLNCHTLFYP